MINLSEHIVEIDGKQYVPYETAVQALVQSSSDKMRESMEDFQDKINEVVKTFNNIKLDNIDD